MRERERERRREEERRRARRRARRRERGEERSRPGQREQEERKERRELPCAPASPGATSWRNKHGGEERRPGPDPRRGGERKGREEEGEKSRTRNRQEKILPEICAKKTTRNANTEPSKTSPQQMPELIPQNLPKPSRTKIELQNQS